MWTLERNIISIYIKDIYMYMFNMFVIRYKTDFICVAPFARPFVDLEVMQVMQTPFGVMQTQQALDFTSLGAVVRSAPPAMVMAWILRLCAVPAAARTALLG